MIMMTNMGMPELLILVFVLLFVIPIVLRSISRTSSINRITPFEINWEAANDEEVRKYLPHLRIQAIKNYRDLTGVGLAKAKHVIDYLIANPQEFGHKQKNDQQKKKKNDMLHDDGIRELIKQGRMNEAITVYQTFTGLPYDEAVQAIEQVEQEVELSHDNPYDSPNDESSFDTSSDSSDFD